MAIRWAVADGAFLNASTWNGNVDIAEEDIVYLNGHHLTFTYGQILRCSEIRNDANDDYGIINGGYISGSANNQSNTVFADIHADGDYVFNTSRYSYLTINGNVYSENGGGIMVSADYGCFLTINGNVECISGYLKLNSNKLNGLTINGNITQSALPLLQGGAIGSNRCTINGNCTNLALTPSSIDIGLSIVGDVTFNQSVNAFSSSPSVSIVGDVSLTTKSISSGNVTDLSIAGNLTCSDTTYLIGGTLTSLSIDGNMYCKYDKLSPYPICQTNVAEGSRITYTSKCPMCWGELNAPSDFNFECVGTETGTHRIINKTLLNDTYPQEGDVEHGVSYGYNSEKEGTFSQPPESVVMEGYVYDFGQKTGTLAVDIPQEVLDAMESIDANLATIKAKVSNTERLIAETKGGVANLPSEQFIAEILGD